MQSCRFAGDSRRFPHLVITASQSRIARYLWVILWLAVTPAMGTQWQPRLDLGVAALDRRTGEVHWEAWQRAELPADASPAVVRAAQRLLAGAEQFEVERVAGQVELPCPLTETQFVRHTSKDLQHLLELTRGTPATPGNVIARFTSDRYPVWPLLVHDGTLCFLLDGRIHALRAWPREEPPQDADWKPSWKFDLQPILKFAEQDRLRLHGVGIQRDEDDLWVVHARGMLRLNVRTGELKHAMELNQPWQMIWNGYGTPVTLGKRHLYYRHGQGVIALDKRTGKEAWRFHTTRSPFPSRLAEVDDDLVLVQIGSDTPHTILAAIVEPQQTIPTILGESNVQRQIAAAQLIHAYGDGYYRPQLGKLAMKWRTGQAAAAREIDRLLQDWPLKRDRQRLIDATVTALVEQTARDRVFTWSVLQGLLNENTPDTALHRIEHYAYDCLVDQPLGLSKPSKRQLAAHCRQVIASGQPAEKGFAASVLVSREVGWESLSDANRKQLLCSDHPAVWRWAALALLKNDRRKTLVTWAPLRSADEQIDVIYVLNQRLPDKLDARESKVWVACAKRAPGPVAYTLMLSLPAAQFDFPDALRQPLRDYLAGEIDQPTVRQHSQAEYDLKAAMGIVHRWHDSHDTTLLLKFLQHPDRNEVYVTNGKKWIYTIRQTAKAYLEERKVPLPAGVIYEEPQ